MARLTESTFLDPTLVSDNPEKKTCGIIMPISTQTGCPAEHWIEVRGIIEEAVSTISRPSFEARLVSDADDVGVIQKKIVQNIYSSDIVVCDVSCKNSNVMFELGMRLAFDKPTVIIKDDQTDYSFDTGIIEHLTYPRDLRFSKIIQFKKLLAEKLLATYITSLDPQSSTFLKNFGTFHVAKLNEDVVSADQLTLEMLSALQTDVARLRREVRQEPESEIKSGFSKRVKGRTILRKLIADYMDKNNISDPTELLNNREFSFSMEKELPAPEYFENPSVFENMLNSLVEQLIINKGQSA